MESVTRGHWIFAGLALLAFAIAMVFAYRRDLQKVRIHYRGAWMIVLGIAVVYFLILMLNRVL